MTPRPNCTDPQFPTGPVNGFEMSETPTHPKTKAFFDYWASKRNGKSVPRRADINPMQIPKLLPDIVLVDIDRSKGLDFKIRLYGTEATEVAREARTGKSIDDLAEGLPDDARARTIERWRKACTHVLETKAPIFTRSRSMNPERRHQIVHTAALPLCAETGEINQLIGLMAIEINLDDP